MAALAATAFPIDLSATVPTNNVAQPAPAQSTPISDDYAGRPINRDGNSAPSPSTRGSANTGSTDTGLGRSILAFGAVIGLILLMKPIGRKLLGATATAKPSRVMQVVTRCPLTPKQQLLMIRIGQRLVVVGDSGTQLTALCQITDADEVASITGALQREPAAGIPKTFQGLFGKARNAYEDESSTSTDPDPGMDRRSANSARAGLLASHHNRDVDPDSGTDGEIDPNLESTRDEIRGLSDTIRGLARSLGKR
jgi:flagellar biogenesis protein FliO